VAAIDFHALGQVIWVSLVAGVGATVLFSVVIYTADKAGDARRASSGPSPWPRCSSSASPSWSA
jgi:hypothetical protein